MRGHGQATSRRGKVLPSRELSNGRLMAFGVVVTMPTAYSPSTDSVKGTLVQRARCGLTIVARRRCHP
eukprot:5708000-Lingulodinium_polyedra.AAC.1